jgi:hypothetical protein
VVGAAGGQVDVIEKEEKEKKQIAKASVFLIIIYP